MSRTPCGKEGGESGSNNGSRKIRTRRSSRRRRKNTVKDRAKLLTVEGKAEITCCSNCGFESKRAFNVVRHYQRIHDPAKRKIECCGRTILTKGDYYQHCADNHPESRKSSIVSRKKYKITKRDRRHEEGQPALGGRKKGERGKKGVKKREEIDSENFLKPKEENCVTIFIEGDPSSPVHAKNLAEFLDNIDFESFKLP